jgi:hypothetical protein
MEVECFGCTKNLGREDPSKIWIWNVAGFEASLCEKCSEIPKQFAGLTKTPSRNHLRLVK